MVKFYLKRVFMKKFLFITLLGSCYLYAGNNYACTFKCEIGNGGGSSQNTVGVYADSNNEAQRISTKMAKRSCKDAGYKGVLSQLWTGSTDCRKR